MDVLYTIVTDGLGHIIIQNGADEPIARLTDNGEWSDEYRAERVGHALKRAMIEDSYNG